MSEQVVEAELTWTEDGFRPGVQLAVDAAGRIVAAGELGRVPSRRLPRRALLPGFVNAHSHAFQRGLRGRGERFPRGAGSFWTWRQAMYELVAALDRQRLYELSRQAFAEMLAAGITAVGEFHYLHHEDAAARDHAFDEVVAAAARDAGIRLVLLATVYQQGDVGRPLAGAQLRFATPDAAAFWRRVDRLAARLDGPLQSLGVAAHSLRAVPPEVLAELQRQARQRGMVLHLHVEEQRREIEACVARYGRTPMELLNHHLEVDAAVTAVHCTHTAAPEMARFLAAGGNVCLCPLTEANLGDGIAGVPAMLAAGGRLCLGTDSNARIAMCEEMRWLEYVQRLAGERRGVCCDGDGRVDRALLACATRHGARALGLRAGRIAPGCWADLVAVDLDHPSLAGWDRDTLLAAFILGGRDDAVAEVFVGGRRAWPAARPAAGS
ncbi:MAG: formimidoylglutamate deiminase [Acidobacteria bacterium]|nr:MAG: formimidoylglutamate deiminase [Acidobacteriota bacterium]